MKRVLFAAFLVLLAEAGVALRPGSLFVMELKGGARVYALDQPAQKGRVLVFHRYPDGVFTSISAEEVARIVAGASEPRSGRLEPGDVRNLGYAAEGPVREPAAAPEARPPEYSPYVMDDYGYGVYWGYGWGGGGLPPHPPRPVHPIVTPLPIGPNGFPILAPPGSPGSIPPPIGSNGFPLISPPPPREPR